MPLQHVEDVKVLEEGGRKAPSGVDGVDTELFGNIVTNCYDMLQTESSTSSMRSSLEFEVLIVNELSRVEVNN